MSRREALHFEFEIITPLARFFFPRSSSVLPDHLIIMSQGVENIPGNTLESLVRSVDDVHRRVQMVFLKQRAEIATLEESDRPVALQALESQMSAIHEKNAALVAEVSQVRDQERQERLKISHQFQDLQREHESQTKIFQEERKIRVEAEKKCLKLTEQLAEVKAMNLKLENDNQDIDRKRKELSDRVAELEIAVDEAKSNALYSARDVNKARKEAETAQETLNHYKTTAEEKISYLQSQLRKIQEKAGSREQQLRVEYAKQLSEMIQERQLFFEEEKNQLLNDQKLFYERTIEGLKKDLALASAKSKEAMIDLPKYKQKAKDLQAELDEQHILLDQRDTLIETLKTQLDEKHGEIFQELDKSEAKVEELKAALENLQDEHTSLMNVKIRLDAEIDTYRQLLDEEELRLQEEGYLKTNQKRRRIATFQAPPTPKTPGTSSKSAAIDMETLADLELETCDNLGRFITLTNATTVPKPLNFYYLVVASSESRFDFPEDAELKPAESMNIWFSDADRPKDSPSDLLWADANVSAASDVIRLYDSNSIQVDETHFSPSSKSCLIM